MLEEFGVALGAGSADPGAQVHRKNSARMNAGADRELFPLHSQELDTSAFSRATLKRHNPRTVRKNTGDAYHGCLVIYVRQSADLYRRMEGTWYGIVGAATRQPD